MFCISSLNIQFSCLNFTGFWMFSIVVAPFSTPLNCFSDISLQKFLYRTCQHASLTNILQHFFFIDPFQTLPSRQHFLSFFNFFLHFCLFVFFQFHFCKGLSPTFPTFFPNHFCACAVLRCHQIPSVQYALVKVVALWTWHQWHHKAKKQTQF